MIQYQVILLAAGQGKRMKAGQNKQFLSLKNKPLLIHTLEAFDGDNWCKTILLVINPDEEVKIYNLLKSYTFNTEIKIIYGGKERQDSVYQGLKQCDQTKLVFIHDGARPFISEHYLHELARKTNECGASLLAVPVTDTIKQVEKEKLNTLNRSMLWAAQTPQAFQFNIIFNAHRQANSEGYLGTDDASLVERMNHPVKIVQGSYDNIKLTTPEDLEKALAIIDKQIIRKKEGSDMFRVGQGFDVHQLVEGRPCIIGGVTIPYEKGLLGHSDADVLLHTVADACLGAVGEGDIGKHFPDTDPEFKDADSINLLARVWCIVKEKGYKLGNLDSTIIAQAPKMAPYINDMRDNIARILEAEPSQINVKATTTEKLGFPGRKEGIASQASVLLIKESE